MPVDRRRTSGHHPCPRPRWQIGPCLRRCSSFVFRATRLMTPYHMWLWTAICFDMCLWSGRDWQRQTRKRWLRRRHLLQHCRRCPAAQALKGAKAPWARRALPASVCAMENAGTGWRDAACPSFAASSMNAQCVVMSSIMRSFVRRREDALRLRDGGGIHSDADWCYPRAADSLKQLRRLWLQRIEQWGLQSKG